MNTKWFRTLICLFCIGMSATLTTVAFAQNKTLSILERVQREENPELAELIRMAIENRGGISKERKFEIIREVTQSYAQIKLLDLQIAEVSRKVESQAGPAEMRYEMLLAKAELESKRATEMANLRDVMEIIPKLPFGGHSTKALNSEIFLQLIDKRVYVIEGQKPFSDQWFLRRWKLSGFLSERETLDYVRKKFKDKESLPVRIRIYYDPETKSTAQNLRSEIISLAKKANAQMETEVHTELRVFVGSDISTFFLRQGKITTFYTHAVPRPDGGSEPLVTGQVNPNDLEQHILWRLLKPKNVPLTFRIEYDEASALVARVVAEAAGDIVKRLGVTELVDVESVLVEPVPETVFLGRWRGTRRSDIQAVDIRSEGVCQVTMGDRFGKDKTPGAIRARTTVMGTWLLTTDGIVIDIKDRSPFGCDYVYRGYLDEEDNLIVDKGQIYPQGSFHVSGEPRQMILKKVE